MWFLVFLFGLVIGSFLNAYLWRSSPSPKSPPIKGGERSVWRGRSVCPKCGKTLGWLELIPLVSFIIQKGRCRGCQKKIDLQYPVVELATALLFVLAYLQFSIFNFQFSILLLLKLFYFFAILIILFVYDLRWGLVPDRVVLPGIVIAFLANIVILFLSHVNDLIHNTLYFILATAVGGGFFAAQYYASKGRWVGAGDIRFGALLGAMLGWPGVLVALFISYLIGGATASVLLLLGKKKFGQTLPMGVFLALGAIIALLWGRQILNWYWPL